MIARNAEKLAVASQDLLQGGARQVVCKKFDLADIDSHSVLLGALAEDFPDYDTVLLAYGVLGDQEHCQRDVSAMLHQLNVNFLSVVALITSVANEFEYKERGTIAVITSVAGDRGRQSNYVYGTAKAGLATFLQGLRNRLTQSGVSVVTIKPGLVNTPMTASLKKGPLFVSPQVVGRGIYRAILAKKDIVYLPWFWRWIMQFITLLPEWLFKRMRL